MSRQLISRATEWFFGAVTYSRAFSGKPGAPFDPLVWHDFGSPETADADGICASQAVAGAGNATIAGALATGGVATMTTPRSLVAVSSNAGDTTQTLTVTGTDVYGATMIETIALNGTTIVASDKAFKTVTQVAVSGALAGNLTVGTGDKLGLPFRVDANDIVSARGAGAADTGTLVAADTTDPATATTGDVRGTFDPSTTLNGSNPVGVLLKIADRSTKIGTYGVDQYDG